VRAAKQEVEVKYHVGAAVVALAFAVTPGSLSAATATTTVLATDYVATTKTLNGLDKNFASLRLRHTAATTHLYAVVSDVPPDPYAVDVPPDPYLDAVPPDPYQPPACRNLALSWNVAVYQNRQQAVFDTILKSAASNYCSLELNRSAVANADGTTDIVSITFAPQ
jgi:hypothetical protein